MCTELGPSRQTLNFYFNLFSRIASLGWLMVISDFQFDFDSSVQFQIAAVLPST
jgi:hypothetical protein